MTQPLPEPLHAGAGSLRNRALEVCAERGLEPAPSLDEPPLTRREFHRAQIAAAIEAHWGGRYVDAEPDPRVGAWLRDHLTEPKRCPALVIAGPTATGKTHQAVAALRVLGAAAADQNRGLNWLAVTHPALAKEMRPSSGSDDHDHLMKYFDAELVILDDLGAAMSTGWATDWLQLLVDERWTKRKATIYTTNLDPEALRAAVGDRVHSRLGDATRIYLAGEDRRWQR